MPQFRLTPFQPGPPIPVELPSGGQLLAPWVQFRCWVGLPGFLTPRDAVVDTGSPFTWMPEALWSQFQPGIDFEWLPYPSGYAPPAGQVVGWTFRFRFARMISPLVFNDGVSEVTRPDVIVQF